MIQTEVVEKIEIRRLRSIKFFFSENSEFFFDNVKYYSRAGQATDEYMVRALCIQDN
jgi:hypothetical protein